MYADFYERISQPYEHQAAKLAAFDRALVYFVAVAYVGVLGWLFGFLLIADGARTMFHSFTYARRSQRKGWWVLTILSALLMIAGIILFVNPWWNTADTLMKVIGCAIFFSSIVSAIRLIWTWPLGKEKGGNEDGEE